MTSLVTITHSNATIRAEHAASLNAAFEELHALTGVWPVVKAGWETRDRIPGGSRTLAEALRAGSGPASDHYENNAKGRAAVDIDNHRLFRNILGDQFEAVLAKHGWRNIQISGAPFPDEPWHFANHNTITITTTGDDDMSAQDVAEIKDAIRRENRRRLYFDQDEKLYYSIDWDLPTGDPAKIAYPTEAQIPSLHSNYQVGGDTAAQAKVLPHARILTLLSIAAGTDPVFTPHDQKAAQ